MLAHKQSKSDICVAPTINTKISQSIKTRGIGRISGQNVGGEPVVVLL